MKPKCSNCDRYEECKKSRTRTCTEYERTVEKIEVKEE